MANFALCIQGGGSRGSYAAGVLDVLMQEKIWADEVVGTSAGALIGCNYVSHNEGRSTKMLLTMMRDRRFMKPSNFLTKGSVFDFRFMLYDLPNQGLPFDAAEFKDNPCKFYAVTTSCLDGKPRYFEKRDPDFWSAVAASASLPLLSKPCHVHSEPFLDGGVSCPIGFEKALQDHYEKIVVVCTRQKGYRKKRMMAGQRALARCLYRRYPAFLEAYRNSIVIYNRQMDLLEKLEAENKAFVIYPSLPPQISHAEKNPKKIRELILQGQNDARRTLALLNGYLSK